MAPSSLLVVLTTLLLFLQTDAASLSDRSIKDGVVSFNQLGRSLLEGSDGGNSTMILAAERTHRKDPSDNLNYYTGGWNITNRHYLFSVAYTAAPLFLLAAIWFVLFVLCLLLGCLCFCCCGRQKYGYSKSAYACSVIFLVLFTVAAIAGAVVLYTGQGKFYDSTTDTLDYVVSQAESTVYNLRNVSAYLEAAKKAGVNQVFLPSNVQNSVDRLNGEIGSAATTLDTETKKNEDRILDALKLVRHILIIVAAVMLVVALLGFLFSICGIQVLVYLLVTIGWILIAGSFILSGVFLALFNVTGDTCVAMDEWVKNPKAHTALDDILPCVERTIAEDSLSESKEVVSVLVEGVNAFITNVTNMNSLAAFNQSGPPVPLVCDPFKPDRTGCAAGEVGLDNATQVWRSYVCQVSSRSTCITTGRLTPSLYDQMAAVVNVSYGLYRYGPFLANLVDCDFARETFSEIHKEHCPDLQRYSGWVTIGLVLVSAAVALSMILWVLYARERRHRKYTKLVDASPHPDYYKG